MYDHVGKECGENATGDEVADEERTAIVAGRGVNGLAGAHKRAGHEGGVTTHRVVRVGHEMLFESPHLGTSNRLRRQLRKWTPVYVAPLVV